MPRRRLATPTKRGHVGFAGVAVRVPDVTDHDPSKERTVGLAVGAGGVLALVAGRLLGSAVLQAFGVVAAITGGGIYAHQKVVERDAKIEEAETTIHSELDDLDPVARAQVLEDLARSAL